MDSHFTVIVSAICTAIFLLDTFALKGQATARVFSCPGARGFDTFSFTNPLHYFRLVLHIFGNQDAYIFLTNLMALIFLGSQMENKYGIPVFSLMTGISSLVSGVLNACLCSAPACGIECAIFLLIFLGAADSLMKRRLELSRVLTLVIYTAFVIYASYARDGLLPQSLLYTLVSFLGGIAGGALGFLVEPKKPREAKTEERTEQRKQTRPAATKKAGKQKIFKPAKLDDAVPTETEIGTLS